MKLVILFIALATLLSGTVHAQVRKCTSKDGKVTYSDFICEGNTASEARVRTDANTIDASGFRRESARYKTAEAVEQAMQKGASSCRFTYFAEGDKKGKELAAAAKQECLNNIAAKASGQPTSLEAYDFWKDHSGQKSARRENAINRASAAENARVIANSNRNAIDSAAARNANRTYKCTPTLLRDALDCK